MAAPKVGFERETDQVVRCPETREPEPAIVVCNLSPPGAFEVRNVSAVPVDLSARVVVQAEVDRRFRNVDAVAVFLANQCGDVPPTKRCVALAPHATLRPPIWSPPRCRFQCGRGCSDRHSLRGRLRFVASTCDGKHVFAGEPFVSREYEIELAGGEYRETGP